MNLKSIDSLDEQQLKFAVKDFCTQRRISLGAFADYVGVHHALLRDWYRSRESVAAVANACRVFLRNPPPAAPELDGLHAEAMRNLEAQAFTPLESRMTQTDEHQVESIADVRAKVERHCSRYGLERSDIAKIASVGSSTLSEFMGGTYKGVNAEIADKVATAIDRDERRREIAVGTSYFKFKISERMRALVHAADRAGCNLALVAPSGACKTMLSEYLVNTLRAVRIDGDDHCVGDFLKLLARSIGIRPKGGKSRFDYEMAIISRIKGTGRLFVIDEAQLLSRKVKTKIRRLHDKTGAMFVMLGSSEMMDDIDDRADGRGQLASRTMRGNAMAMVRELPMPDGWGGEPLAEVFEMDELSAWLKTTQLKVDQSGLEMLHEICCIPDCGLMRNVVQLLKIANYPRDRIIDRRTLRGAIEVFFGDDADKFVAAIKAVRQALGRTAIKDSKPARIAASA